LGEDCVKSPSNRVLKRKEKTGMEFISGERREQLLLLPDCLDD
jgi:hypothetical protein